MSLITINQRTINNRKSSTKPYFLRDSSLKGFGIKVYPSGRVTFVAEIWHNGRSHRKTLGEYPVIKPQEAKIQALEFISEVRLGYLQDKAAKNLSLESLFIKYVSGGRLKQRTVTDYSEAVSYYLSDWLQKPVASITKQMVESRFYKIRDKGIGGGKPTYSQATKTMRILSALMNYAMADELIESNPVQVLKLKRIDRSIRKRDNYLPAVKVQELLQQSSQDAHPVTLAVHLMLYAGLRKNEALRLLWSDIEEIEGVRCIIIRDTKNKRPHYVPVTTEIQRVLARAKNNTAYIFPSTQKKGASMGDVRSTLRRLSKQIQYDFRCHDLRRTFATRASEVGIDYLMVKRLLNHKSNDITAQYIQWHSRENLMSLKKALESVKY